VCKLTSLGTPQRIFGPRFPTGRIHPMTFALNCIEAIGVRGARAFRFTIIRRVRKMLPTWELQELGRMLPRFGRPTPELAFGDMIV
jgi:hypothetical protein